jgi:RHS repeat-associated protein
MPARHELRQAGAGTWPVAGSRPASREADHLGRTIRITDAAKATVWQATWLPWVAPYQITGALTLDARFPGQCYQLEAGLHYNWHRHYDPTLGRYTQADPLGFVGGPSVYGYARESPQQYIDPDGRFAEWVITIRSIISVARLTKVPLLERM